jgi:integrase
MKLTAAIIDSLTCPPGRQDKTYFDDSLPGFGLRIRASGVRRWVVQYELHGRTRRIVIGPPEVIGLEEARRIARRHLAKKALGIDVAVEKAEARKAARQTLGSIVDNYLAGRKDKIRPSSMRSLERYLQQWWQPLHGLPISRISRADIAAHLSGPPVAAGRARSALMGFFSWAIKQGHVDANPVIGTDVPHEHIKPRERVLSLDELAAIWKACNGAYAYDMIVRLLIVTGCRRQEVGSMRWAELNRAEGTWTIPAARSKSDRSHTLPLPALAWSIIDAWTQRGAFPDRLFSGKGFGAWAMNKRALDARCGVEGWTLHDLRRSVATHLGDMGIAPHTIEAILGHTLGSRVARTYNRSPYLDEMRTALAMWADHIETLVEGAERKIVPLRIDSRQSVNAQDHGGAATR